MFAVTIPEPAGPSAIEVLAQLLPALAIELSIVLVLAFFVARIGGPPGVAASPADPSVPTGTRSARRTALLTLVVAAGTLLLGILIGREVAREFSIGGLAGIAAIGLIVFLVMVVVGLVLAGLLATAFRHGHVTWAIGRVLLSAGFLAAGAVVGNVTAVATGAAYPAPVILVAAGDTHIQLKPAGMPFAARDGGRAECRSVQDSRDVQEVTAFELGELGPGTLRAVLSLGQSGANDASVILYIDEGDLPAGALQPAWEISPNPTAEVKGSGTSGTVTFELARNVDVAASAGPASADWPLKLSGVMSWTCQPW